jgi:hypothetical protein
MVSVATGKPTKGGLKPAGGGKRVAIRRENPLQKACVELYSKGRGYRSSILFAVPNGEDRHPITAARLVGMSGKQRLALPEEDMLMPWGLGVLPGACDLILLTAPRIMTPIEMKVPADPGRGLKAGRQSKQQELFMTACQDMGFDYRLIYTEQDFYDLLIEKGVKLTCGRPWGTNPPMLPPVKTGVTLLPHLQQGRRR